MRQRRALLAVGAAVALATGSCGGGTSALTVSAAASLRDAFTKYAKPGVRISFGGSDLLAAQIKAGVRPDVFASANLKLPAELYAAKLVDKPIVFAANRLVLAVPAHQSRVRSLADLSRPGTTLAIGSATVPVGAYTRQVLVRLGAQGARILARARSGEPDVASIVGKLVQGVADAGFVYATDVRATRGALRAIELPARVRPGVAYAAALVRGTAHASAARAFIAGLLSGAGATALRTAGFEPPQAG